MFALLLTCEHAGNEIPMAYRKHFEGADSILQSHRGWDPGAIDLATTFRDRLSAPLMLHKVTRLLVEPNRSIGHHKLFSEFTEKLTIEDKRQILAQYYNPHRNLVTDWVARQLTSKRLRVLHLSLHTFTPIWNGTHRTADVGLLYDPARSLEARLCQEWKSRTTYHRPDLQVRRNYPYLGKSDGLTSTLRQKFGADYLGIELEVNQRWLDFPSQQWMELRQDLAECFASAKHFLEQGK